ncbi:hypothetical protein ACVW16_002699 [Bradyrhizobium sp. USDA 4474]
MGNPDSMICEGQTVPRRAGEVKCSAATLGQELINNVAFDRPSVLSTAAPAT